MFLLVVVVTLTFLIESVYSFHTFKLSKKYDYKLLKSITNHNSRNILLTTKLSLNDWIIEQGSKKDEIKIDFQSTNNNYDAIAKCDIKNNDIIYNFPYGACINVNKGIRFK